MHIHSSRIIFEDEHLLGVNKLSNELVVKGSGTVGKLPLFDLLRKDHPGLRAVHRLDFETSGVVVFAKSKPVEKAIIESSFAGWEKTYHTLVVGRLPRDEGVIRAPLPARGGGKVPAETRYRVLHRFVNSSEVLVIITTGRHHQIRRHFQFMGHPLVLDHIYGNKPFNRVFTQEFKLRHFFLHAEAVSFPHPMTSKLVNIEAPLPSIFLKMLQKLKSGSRN